MEAAGRCAARYNGEKMEQIAQHTGALLQNLQAIVSEAQALTVALSEHKTMSIADQWVDTWGETVNKKTAAEMLGVSPSQITKLVTAGTLATTPDGRVLVRQAAIWANSGVEEKAGRKAHPARRKVQAFRP